MYCVAGEVSCFSNGDTIVETASNECVCGGGGGGVGDAAAARPCLKERYCLF